MGVASQIEPLYSVASQLKTLMADGNGHAEGHGAEDDAGQRRLAADEHVVAPDEEADQGDGHAADRR